MSGGLLTDGIPRSLAVFAVFGSCVWLDPATDIIPPDPTSTSRVLHWHASQPLCRQRRSGIPNYGVSLMRWAVMICDSDDSGGRER